MSTLTWITEKELESSIKKKKKKKRKKKRETYFVGRKIGKYKEAVRKRRIANKVEVSGSEKKKLNRNT